MGLNLQRRGENTASRHDLRKPAFARVDAQSI